MKRTATLFLMLAWSMSSFAIAQSGDMKDMPKKDMDMNKCMDMMGTKDMKSMDMKDMDMQQCKGMKGMKDMEMDHKANGTAAKGMVHKATGVVKAIDPAKGTVTLAHGPVKSLKWPAMTMSFVVKDKTLFDKLAVDKKVKVEFTQKESDYIVTAVK